MKITDDMIKKKRKEFNARVSNALNGIRGNVMGTQFSPAIQELRQLAQMKKPTLGKPSGG